MNCLVVIWPKFFHYIYVLCSLFLFYQNEVELKILCALIFTQQSISNIIACQQILIYYTN